MEAGGKKDFPVRLLRALQVLRRAFQVDRHARGGNCTGALDLPAASAIPATATISASSRILLIEDEPVNIQAVSSILKAKGYQISVATNGQHYLDLISRVRPELILLDVMMPG